MKTSTICYAVISLLFFACTDKNKIETQDLSVTSKPYSDATQPQTKTPALTPEQQDSMFVSEFVTEWYPANKPNFEELKPLKQYVPSGYILYNYFLKDLNGDGLTDCIMLVTPKEQTQEYESDLVLLYVRQKDKTLKLHAKNKTFSSFPNEAFIETDSINGGFIISTHMSGMGRHAIVTNTSSHFTYNKKEKDWFLNYFCFFQETLGGRDLVDEDGYPIRDEEGNFIQDTTEYEEEPLVMLNNGEECTKYLTQKDFGKIRFAKYNLESMRDEQW